MFKGLIVKAAEWMGGQVSWGGNKPEFVWGGWPTRAGVELTPESSLNIIAYQRAISIISGALSVTPIWSYRTGKRREYAGHRLDRVFNTSIMPDMSATVGRQFLWHQVLTWGNFYALKLRRDPAKRNSEVIGLQPFLSAEVKIQYTENGQRYYRWTRNGVPEDLPAEQVFHVPYLITRDGVEGLSLVGAHREFLGLHEATEAHSSLFFKNGARLSGALQFPQKLSDEALRKIRESWSENYEGIHNSAKVAILEQGVTFNQYSVNPKDAELLGQRSFNDSRIAMMCGVPPHLLGITEKVTSWGSGIEQLTMGFQRFTLLPLAKVLEGQIKNQLTGLRDDDVEFRHDFSELLRPDFKSLVESLGSAHRDGLMTANEGRELLDYDQRPEGEKLVVQAQMTPLADAGKQVTGDGRNATQDPSV